MDFGQTLRPGDRSNAVATMQKLLAEYGYGIEVNSEYDVATRDVVAAFQRHFRPERVDGTFDASTRSTLQELLAGRGRGRTIAARARTTMTLTAPDLVS